MLTRKNSVFGHFLRSVSYCCQGNRKDLKSNPENHPTLKAIGKYWNHHGILAIEGKLKSIFVFTFCHITLEETLKKKIDLGSSKSSQDIDVPTKIVKDDSDIFASFIYHSFDNMIGSTLFPAAIWLVYQYFQ